MIDLIERDYSISTEKQKKLIIKDYAANGKTVLLINSWGDGKMQVFYKLAEV